MLLRQRYIVMTAKKPGLGEYPEHPCKCPSQLESIMCKRSPQMAGASVLHAEPVCNRFFELGQCMSHIGCARGGKKYFVEINMAEKKHQAPPHIVVRASMSCHLAMHGRRPLTCWSRCGKARAGLSTPEEVSHRGLL